MQGDQNQHQGKCLTHQLQNSTPYNLNVQYGTGIQIIDKTYYYRLTTMWQTQAKSLDIINDGNNDKLKLSNTGQYSGQQWRMIPVAQFPGWYNLTSAFTPNKVLDVVNDGIKNNQLEMRNPEQASGQYWRFMKAEDYKGYYRIQCMWQPNMSIDIVNDGVDNDKPWLDKTGDYSGQLWKMHKTKLINT